MNAVEQNYWKLGLIGHPVAHSISPLLHRAALSYAGLDGEYNLLDIRPQDLPAAFKHLVEAKYQGVNVTVPHKQAVLSLMDELTVEAVKVQAVNTISIAAGGKLTGHNTDLGGFVAALRQFIPSDLGQQDAAVAMVLGAGGAARAAVWGLLELGFRSLVIVARRIEQAEELIAQVFRQEPALRGQVDIYVCSNGKRCPRPTLVVNCTPAFSECLGLDDVIASLFEGAAARENSVWFYDMVYSPKRLPTPLITCFKQKAPNVRCQDGLQMLTEQAALAFGYWSGVAVPAEVMIKGMDFAS